MNRIESLVELAGIYVEKGYLRADKDPIFKDVVEVTVEIGRRPEVHDQHDDFIGLQTDLPKGVQTLTVEEADASRKYQAAVQRVLDEANIILPLAGFADDDGVDDDDDDHDVDDDDDVDGVDAT